MLRQEALRERLNILFPVSEWTKPQANAVDAVKQFAAETPGAHLVFKIPASGRNHASREAAFAENGITIRQSVQKLSLARGIEFADFIEEDRPTLAPGDAPVGIQVRVAEKLARIHGRARHPNQRSVAPH